MVSIVSIIHLLHKMLSGSDVDDGINHLLDRHVTEKGNMKIEMNWKFYSFLNWKTSHSKYFYIQTAIIISFIKKQKKNMPVMYFPSCQ